MARRLTRITTGTGDDGSTGLADGSRLSKCAPRIEALGAVDELNSFLGLLRAEQLPPDIDAVLGTLQQDLFDLGAELAMPGRAVLAVDQAAAVGAAVAAFNTGLPPLAEFILPGGTRASALCHVARAVCRRAERALEHLARTESVNRPSCVYLNRAGDLLFVLARVLARHDGLEESNWRGPRRGA